MAVGGPFAAGLAGTIRSALIMNVDIAIVGVMMMFPCTDRSRDVVHRMRHRRSRRRAERDGRDQEHQASKEPTQNEHAPCDNVTLSYAQGFQ